MPVELPAPDVETLLDYAPARHYAVWQHPEGRYAYSIDGEREAWLIVLASEEMGMAYLLEDARMNGRDPSLYRLDEVTLPDAFAAARGQAVPFRSSQGFDVRRVLGILLIEANGTIRTIPL